MPAAVIKALVVDDSAFMRRAVTQMLQSDPGEPGVEVVGSARNGREGFELAKKLRPDIITLDIEMPEMDGLTALRHIMRECPTRVLMLSSLTTAGSQASLTALKLGAADFLAKDMSQVSLSITNIQGELLAKVRALASTRRKPTARPAAAAAHDAPPVFRPGQFDVICIGSSTGGPPVLETILCPVPANISAPIVVAQHMPALFTESMVQRLIPACKVPVVHAVEGRTPLQPRTIYIAQGGKNIHLRKLGLARWELLVNDEPIDALYRPSVDALLSSAAKATAARSLGIVLTGIGEDGLRGARDLRAAGGTLIAQNEETCVVYGMPKAVTQAALTHATLSPEQIARVMQSLAVSAVAA